MNEIYVASAEEFELNIFLFQDYIHEVTLRQSELNVEERRMKILESIKFEQFYKKLCEIFRHDLNEYYTKNFYKKLCVDPDCQFEWSDLFGYAEEEENEHDEDIEEKMAKKNKKLRDEQKKGDKKSKDGKNNKYNEKKSDGESTTELLLGEVQIFMASFKFRVGEASGDKAKRDIIQNIQYAPDIDSFLVVAQKGAVSVWNNKEQIDGWLNGCCLLPNIKRIVITAERSITFWDYRSTKKNYGPNAQMGLSNLTCIDSINKHNNHKESDKVIIGDSFGYIMTLEVNSIDLAPNNTVLDLVDPTKKVVDFERLKHAFIKKKVHDESVTKIIYVPEMSCFISCSISEKISLVIEDLNKFENKDIRIARQIGIPKGVNAVCYCIKASLIATAGADKNIRLFNPLILNKSCIKLAGHVFTIVDLICNEKDQQLISLSAERLFRVWDLSTFKCLQVFSDTETRPGEKRIYCIAFDQKRDRMLSCSSVIDCWPLSRSVNDNTLQTPRTHDRPIISICYSANQIATLCAESVLKVWEADTGRFLYAIREANGSSVDIVCMTTDPSGYKLATGGSNGSIKIWNFGTGHEMKNRSNTKKINDNEFKIVNMHYAKLKNDLYLFVYDSFRIKIFLDSNDSNDLILVKIFTNSIGMLNSKPIEFNKYTVIPLISSRTSQKKEENEFNEVSLMDISTDYISDPEPISSKFNEEQLNAFKQHRINSLHYSKEKDWLMTGNHEIIVWNMESLTLEKILHSNSGIESGSDAPKNQLSKVNSMRLILKKEKIESEMDIIKEYGNKEQFESTSLESLNKENHEEKEENAEDNSQMQQDSNEEDKEKEEEVEVFEAFFNYMIVTAHNDSTIRFWNENDQIIAEVSALRTIKSSQITSLIIEYDRNFVYTGDTNGYITIWSYDAFVNRYNLNEAIRLNENSELFKLVVCWRAHMNKIIDLVLNPENKLIFSTSVDESVRVWWGQKGKYIGYLGQKKPFVIPTKDQYEFSPPIDITEPPIFVNKAKADKKMEKNYEYPLVLDKKKLHPKKNSMSPKNSANKSRPRMLSAKRLSISAINLNNNDNNKGRAESQIKIKLPHVNKRYFNALVKPKHSYLNAADPTRSSLIAEGSIFSSLPLYEESASLDPSEFKALLATNPYRTSNKEISYIMPEKIVKRKFVVKR